jgi:surface antigen
MGLVMPYAFTRVLICLPLLAASGCESMGPNQNTGTVGGAVLGGLIGGLVTQGSGTDKLLGVAAGAAIGGALGNWIGAQLDERDRQRHLAAVRESYDSGRPVSWQNPQNKTSGMVTAVQPLNARPGCYSADDSITVNGQEKNTMSTYCRQTDGSFAFAS